MDKNWNEIDAENQRLFEMELEEAKKSSSAARDFFSAGLSARRSVREHELLPVRDENGEFVYTPQQAFKAACLAREDVVATLELQLAILKRLDRNHSLVWVAILILSYIAYRVS